MHRMYSLSITKDDLWIGKTRKAKEIEGSSIEYHRFGTVPTVINKEGTLKCSLDGFVKASIGVKYTIVDGKATCSVDREQIDPHMSVIETYNDTGLLEKYGKTANSVVSNAVGVKFPNGQKTRMQFIFAFTDSNDMYLDGVTVNASNVPRIDEQMEMLLKKNAEFVASEKTYHELYSSTTANFFVPHPIQEDGKVPTISVGSSLRTTAGHMDMGKHYDIAAKYRQDIDYRQRVHLPFFSH